VVDLRDDGEPVAAGEPFDDPHLPQRLRAIELLRHDAAGEALQLILVARARQAGMSHVVLDVEVLIVDPDRVAFERGVGEHLAVAWNQVEPRLDVVADPLHVDAARRGAERPGFVGRGPGDVHVVGRALGDEK
jgi:hypothetical protein